MGANDNVTIRIVSDATGVRPGVEAAVGSIGSLEPMLAELNASMKAMSAQMVEGFARGAAGARQLAVGIEEAKVASGGLTAGLTGMIGKIHQGAESVRTFQMRAKEFAELYVAMFAGEAVMHWAERMGEAAEKTARLAAQVGMTTGQVQALSGAATLSGTNIDALTKGLAMMDNRAVTAAGHSSTTAKALQAMGISAEDGTSNMQRLIIVADKFRGMEDGPQKLALAMQLFGRSGRDMIPFLNQGSAAIQDLIEKSKEYGAVNDKAQAQGEKLAESVNLAKIAWEGLKNTLTEAFGPLLTQIVDGFSQLVKSMRDSYESGGAVKVIFDAISATVQALGEMVSAVALAWDTQFNTMKAQGVDWGTVVKTVIEGIVVAFKTVVAMVVFFEDAFIAAFHLMKGAAEAFLLGFIGVTGGFRVAGTALGEFMKVVGQVVWDALHLNWGAIKADWEDGMEHVRQAVDAKAQQIVGEVNQMKNSVKSDFADMMGTGKSFSDFFDKLMKPGAGAPHDAPKINFGGGGGDAPDITNPSKGKKGKSDKPSITAQWKQELSDMLLNEQNWGADEAKLSLKFWEDKLALTKKGSKEELEVRREINQQKLAVFRDDQAGELANIKQIEAIKLDAAKTDVALQRLTLQEKLQAIDEEEKRGQLSATRAIAARNEVNRQLYQLDAQEEAKEYQLHLQALQDELKLEHLKPKERDAINRQIELLEKQHLDRMRLLNQQTDAKIKADSDKLRDQQIADVRRVTDSYTSAIAKMLTLQQGAMSTLKSLWGSLQETVAGVLDKVLQKFVLNEAIKLGVLKTDAASTIGAEVAKAGAGGTASMAAAPFPINLSAPEFGAAMASLAASYGSVAAFDVGAWNLSKDQLAVVHAGEMIIPPHLAGGIRGLFQAVGNDNRQPAVDDGGSFSSGDVHLHIHSVIPPDRREIEQFLLENHQGVGKAVRKYVRQNGNTGK